jgi:quinol monooxygenase YgiN
MPAGSTGLEGIFSSSETKKPGGPRHTRTSLFILPIPALTWPFLHPTGDTMYGLIGKMLAVEGRREALMQVLMDGVSGMPGCLSYIIARDPSDPEAIWITEVWESKASHEASLRLPSVQQAIAAGRPMIAGFGPERFETEPVGGHGLVQPDSA